MSGPSRHCAAPTPTIAKPSAAGRTDVVVEARQDVLPASATRANTTGGSPWHC